MEKIALNTKGINSKVEPCNLLVRIEINCLWHQPRYILDGPGKYLKNPLFLRLAPCFSFVFFLQILFVQCYWFYIRLKAGMLICKEHIQFIPSTVFCYNIRKELAPVFLGFMEPMTSTDACLWPFRRKMNYFSTDKHCIKKKYVAQWDPIA